MARSAMLSLILALSVLTHRGSTEFHPQNNLTDCLNAINSLPNSLDPGSGLPREGDYVAPIYGMTILGDSCMMFCGVAQDLQPAIRPISAQGTTTLVTTTTPVRTISMQSTGSSTGAEKPRKAIQTSTTVITVDPPATPTPQGGPPKEAGAPPTTISKRQQVPPPSIPPQNAAVKLKPGNCLKLCPNAILHSDIPITSTGPSSTSTVVLEHVTENGGRRKLTPAFIVLAIVLPVLTTVAALAALALMLKYRRRCKVLSNERGRNIEMPERYWRTQK